MEENLLAFSTLKIDSMRPLELAEMAPRLEQMLDRLMRLLKAERAALFVNERWRDTLPSVERGFTPEFLPALNAGGAGDALSSFVFRLQGLAVLRGLPQELAQLPPGQ